MLKGLVIFPRKESELLEDDYSVKRLLEAAEKKNIDLTIVTPNQFELVVTRSDRKSILIDDKQIPLPDFVIPRMGSDTSYYTLSVIRQLGYLGVYVCNDADAIYSVKDKLYMHQQLAHSSLATPNTMLAKFPIEISVVRREIGFPLVIKNVTGTQGSGIYLCESEDKFMDVMELIYTNNDKANIILQEFIQKSRGQDLRAFVVGGKVIACMRRSSETSFKANFSKGGNVESFEITPEIEWLSTETTKLLNLDIAGVDLLFDENGFKVCEANSSPGFHGLEKVVGKCIAEDILDYIIIRTGSQIN
ncbi:MAG: RimK family alpha-L-glutamate ligase [Chlamydiales bacterium]|nr:RimK family alpha-L-glutamate ligase [Chlamydiales bacterium]NCF70796.1 RimK family alpha-L-glutamate ligase [Chlamydiales bacterium]